MRKILIATLTLALLLPGCVPADVSGTVVDKVTYYEEPLYVRVGVVYMPTGGGERHKLKVECSDGVVREKEVSSYDYESYEIGDTFPKGAVE